MTDSPRRDSGATATERYQEFLQRYPKYADTHKLDELRARDYARLDEQGHVYLDYTGGGVYGESQVRGHCDLLLGTVLGNPHSENPTSLEATRLVESCRRRVADFFHASPAEYTVVFTANASHALKLVGEAYPFGEGDQFLLTFDNHNSVNGIREFDRAHGARTRYVPVMPPPMRVPEDILDRYLSEIGPGRHNLFAYPAQSNFSGVQHPLEWIGRAQRKGWDVLLDAAAFVPTNRLDLSRHHPEFVALSFYKMFGYPTGVGALVARRDALERLHRPWFAGGTITVASVQADQFYLTRGAEAFEDGTVNYTGLPAIVIGLDLLDEVGIEVIHDRVVSLTGWLLENVTRLKHGNGEPVVRIYGPTSTDLRGGTVTMNVYDEKGVAIDHTAVEALANKRNISLRTGCFCNPGAGEMALGLEKDELDTCFAGSDSRMTFDQFRQCIDGKSTGAVRVSVGLVSNFADVEAFLDFIAEFRRD
jgi:selenocysteine lyase/cysteine desulfurase